MLRLGYMIGPNGEAVRKPDRPKTIGEARQAIKSVFERNRWEQHNQFGYMENQNVEPKGVDQLDAGEIRTILAAMEKHRMILFFN